MTVCLQYIFLYSVFFYCSATQWIEHYTIGLLWVLMLSLSDREQFWTISALKLYIFMNWSNNAKCILVHNDMGLTIPYSTVLHCTILYCAVPYHTIQYSTVLYLTIGSLWIHSYIPAFYSWMNPFISGMNSFQYDMNSF